MGSRPVADPGPCLSRLLGAEGQSGECEKFSISANHVFENNYHLLYYAHSCNRAFYKHMFRKTIFWIHLAAGVLAGIVVFTMSVTGVLLTYERQMKRWAAESNYVPAAEQGERLSLDQLLDLQKLARPELTPTTAIVTNHPGAPVALRAGRQGGIELNPYNGSEMHTEAEGLSEFFGVVTRFHRWFNIEGENRAIARQVTGVANVVFLFLCLSGMYLWFPAVWKKAMFKARLLLRKDYADAKARDFHWHHIFGIWMAIPLIFVVYTGMVISYPWAANFMYRVFGAEVPVQQQAGGGPGAGGPGQAAARQGNGGGAGAARAAREISDQHELVGSGMVAAMPTWRSLEDLVASALADADSAGWKRLTLTLPDESAPQVKIEIDHGNGAQAQLRHTLTLDRSTGSIVERSGFADIQEAQRLRGIARFLHTGEVLGFWGQTIAGLASAAGVLLVWTGFALAWRRLIQPLFRKTA